MKNKSKLLNTLTATAASILGVLGVDSARAGIIASDNFGGGLSAIRYRASAENNYRLYVPNSGSGQWTNPWYTSSDFNVQNSNLNHPLSVIGNDGFSIGGAGRPGTAALRTFAATPDISYSFLSRGTVLFDLSDSRYLPLDIQLGSNNGNMNARLTYTDQNGDWNDRSVQVGGVSTAQTVMTVVQIQTMPDNSRIANIWFLPDHVTSFIGVTPNVTLQNIYQQSYDRIVINTFNSASVDSIVVGQNINDVIAVPTSGAYALMGIGGIIAASGLRRRARAD